MSIPREAYKALETIVGAEYISEDPVIMEAYFPPVYESDLGYGKEICTTPACVILPETTEEVQRIVAICNRYKIPYVPVSTYWAIRGAPKVPDCISIDLKRMKQMEIDEKHMYAIVEPGVIYSQLQEEAMKRGLYTLVAGGGSQVSVLANHLIYSLSPLCYRVGLAGRRILGFEWVLPDGEILKIGSLSQQDDPYWGEGPGPDLRGILRGYVGWFGALGVVTKLAVKLFPFQPEKLKPIGISPETTLELPGDRMRWYNISFPSLEKLIEAMQKIGEAEIAAAVTRVPVFWRYLGKAKSKEDFWEQWDKPGKEAEIANTHIARVLIIGYTSEKQLEYEERVLMDIVAELGGEPRRTKPTDASWFKNADSVGMWWMTGGYTSVEYIVESLQHAVKQGEAFSKLKQGFTPPLMEDYGDPGWFQVGEMGHTGYSEFLTYFDPYDDDMDKVDQWYLEVTKENVRKGFYTAFQNSLNPLHLTGPAYGPNYHKWLLDIKNAFDPNKVSNPPVPLDEDEFVDRAEWMKPMRDW